MNSFTLIAYKPSGDDYCRGCLMDSYSSDHHIYINLTKQQLIDKWAEVEMLSFELDGPSYMCTIISNNEFGDIILFDDNCVEQGTARIDDEDAQWRNDECYDYFKPIKKLKEEKLKGLKDIHKKKIEEEKRQEALKEQRRKEESEKKELIRLQQKYK